MSDARKYLLPSEVPVIRVRLHWAKLAADTIQSSILFVLGVVLARAFVGTGLLEQLAVYFTVFVVIRWAWIMADWYVERFVVTDKRVLLVSGIATRKVAIMPLIKVTDLTYNRSATGLMFGYGEFVVESAGQDQALSKINFIPRPEKLYIQISELLFGGDKGSPALPSPGEREAELEAGKRALQRRTLWRSWPRRRRWTRTRAEPSAGGVNDLLAQRDILIAERERKRRLVEPERAWGEADAFDDEPDATQELPIIHQPRRDAARRGPVPSDPYVAPEEEAPEDLAGPAEPPPVQRPHALPADPADD